MAKTLWSSSRIVVYLNTTSMMRYSPEQTSNIQKRDFAWKSTRTSKSWNGSRQSFAREDSFREGYRWRCWRSTGGVEVYNCQMCIRPNLFNSQQSRLGTHPLGSGDWDFTSRVSCLVSHTIDTELSPPRSTVEAVSGGDNARTSEHV